MQRDMVSIKNKARLFFLLYSRRINDNVWPKRETNFFAFDLHRGIMKSYHSQVKATLIHMDLWDTHSHRDHF